MKFLNEELRLKKRSSGTAAPVVTTLRGLECKIID